METTEARPARPQRGDELELTIDSLAFGGAGVGPSFPILGYDDLNANQVQSRLGGLSKPELRKVLTYERNNANRKSVTGAVEKAIG